VSKPPRELVSSFHYQHDNRELLIRWVRPYDRDGLAAALDMMSDKALYQRFFMPIKQLTDRQLEFFTNVDQVDHIAWGILDTDHPHIPGLGIARCVRDQEYPHIAEAAVTVPDAFQGQGFGTLLLAILHLSAARNKIHILRSIVLNDNHSFIRLLKSLGGVSSPGEDNTVVIDQPVYARHSDIPAAVENDRFRELMRRLESVIYTQ